MVQKKNTMVSDSDVDTPLPQDVDVDANVEKVSQDTKSTKAKAKAQATKAKKPTQDEATDETHTEKAAKKKTMSKKRKTDDAEATANMSISDGSDSNDSNHSQEAKKKSGPSPIPRSMAKRVQTALKDNESISSDVSIDKIQDILTTYRLMTIDDVANGLVVSEPNFLTYKRKAREERVHTNPKTNEPIVKPRHYVLCVEVKASTKDRFAEIPLDPKDIEALDEMARKKSQKNKKE